MCGILGMIVQKEAGLTVSQVKQALNRLFILSESRGKEAAGVALRTNERFLVYKAALSAGRMIKKKEYQSIFAHFNPGSDTVLLGHSRLVTDGEQSLSANNQPVVKEGIAVIHNGIIVNVQKLWQESPELKREYTVDTEIIPVLIRHSLKKGDALIKALQTTFQAIEGSASVAAVFNDRDCFILATNTGSIYFAQTPDQKIFLFASEKYILRKLLKNISFREKFARSPVNQLRAGEGYFRSLKTQKDFEFPLIEQGMIYINEEPLSSTLRVEVLNGTRTSGKTITSQEPFLVPESIRDHDQNCASKISRLQRCKKCVLPVTFPLINLDTEGVCQFCRNHQKKNFLGEKALLEKIGHFEKSGDEPNCIVSLSGGRDSCFTLHYVKKVLGLKPIAYSYDWGMITDLGRRNQARLCGKLGVEHILVSADIAQKRKNIGKNVSAWLKKPHLGMIPLFMAGDKQYFFFAERLKKQTGIGLVVMGENYYEKTGFKTAFSLAQEKNKGLAYQVTAKDQMKMAWFYLKQFAANPEYINPSLWDSFSAFRVYYEPRFHNYINLFDYIPWQEQPFVDLLRQEYNWEISPDSSSTWRIGDGTAAFYNYIYHTVAGFTEHDTFRSNQIRENVLDREEALKLVNEENQPSYLSLKNYCDLIKLDLIPALKTIQDIPKLY